MKRRPGDEPQAARRELLQLRLVLVGSSGLAAVTTFATALGCGFGGGVAGGALLLRRAGREKHGGSSQGDGKESDHRKCRLVTLELRSHGLRSP